jgi:AraC family transcriptional regulator of adaptative response/methylated-DNA-[protein]-cysteine methyltransferase
MEKKMELFKTNIQSGDNVTRSLYNAGFGSSSRLYEKASQRLGMTPGKYKNGGKGESIIYSILDTILGKMLIAATHHGVCSIRFGSDENELLANLKDEFPHADCQPNSEKLSQWIDILNRYFNGYTEPLDIPLDVQPTAFRAKVWEELRRIPFGETRSYTQVAQAIGQPSAVRAVASACAANPVAIVTPCHRVVHNDGSVSGYRWGVERKKALLESEHKILSKSA